MGTGDERIRRYHWALIFLTAAAVVCVSFRLAYEVRRNRELTEKLKATEAETEMTLKSCASAEARIGELETAIEKVKGLPKQAETARQRFFDEAEKLEEMVQNGETDLKIAYLTFDDGPYEITEQYLDVLEKYGILATFFQRGRDWDTFGQTYIRVARSGHTIGNHTFSHQIRGGIYRSVQAFMDDVIKNRTFIYEKLGITTDVLRFPGGSGTAGSLKQDIIEELRKEGYAYVNWNSATMDGMYDLSAEEYRDNVLDKTGGRKFLVVLMHDYNRNTLKALPEIIEGLESQGYVFLPLFYESLAVNR